MESYRTSNNRIQYRANHKRRTGKGGRKSLKDPASKLEILIMQSIVCLIVLALALIVRIVNTNFTNNTQNRLKDSISQNPSVSEATDSVAQTFNSAKDTILDFLGLKLEEQIVEFNAEEEAVSTFLDTLPAGEFRIDEEILEQINNEKK